MVTAVSLSVTEGDPEGNDLGPMGQVLTSPLAGHRIGLIAHPARPNVHLGLPSSPGTKHCFRSTLTVGRRVAPQALGASAVSAGVTGLQGKWILRGHRTAIREFSIC